VRAAMGGTPSFLETPPCPRAGSWKDRQPCARGEVSPAAWVLPIRVLLHHGLHRARRRSCLKRVFAVPFVFSNRAGLSRRRAHCALMQASISIHLCFGRQFIPGPCRNSSALTRSVCLQAERRSRNCVRPAWMFAGAGCAPVRPDETICGTSREFAGGSARPPGCRSPAPAWTSTAPARKSRARVL
jgi:hypothetical protein